MVCLREEPFTPTKWRLARMVTIHPGGDGKVYVVTVETEKDRDMCLIVKIVPLVYNEDKIRNRAVSADGMFTPI